MDNELKRDGARNTGSGKSRSAQSSAEARMADAKSGAAKPAAGDTDGADNLTSDITKKAQSLQDNASETLRDVKEQARDRYDTTVAWASDRYDNAARGARQARKRSVSELDRVRRNAEDLVAHNPIMIGVAGLAAGLLVGALLPRTQRENEAFGRWSDEMREQGKRYAVELAQQGRDMVTEALTPEALKAAAESAQPH